jgi:hypothetical protein
VLTAYKSIHYFKRKKGKSGVCAIKLDMTKAYDRVEWNYLWSIMTQMGFNDRWVNLIMRCVELVKLSVKINGHISESFSPSRGICQGGPMPPYLFLICVEGLSCLLKH